MISTLAGLLLQAAAPAPAPTAWPPLPPPRRMAAVRARANLASLFSDEDYPEEAVLKREEGTVGFRLQVGPDGTVGVCTITASSGHVSLDSTTCRLLTERARFSPARDRRGRPTGDSVVGRITWRLPEVELPPLEPSLEILTMRATPEGEVTCSTTFNGTPADRQSCPRESTSDMVDWSRTSGKIIEQTVVTIVTPSGERERVDGASHGTRIAAIDSVLRIAPDGSVLDCRVSRKEVDPNYQPNSRDIDMCREFAVGTRLFKPASGSAERTSRVVDIKIRAFYRLVSPSNLPIA